MRAKRFAAGGGPITVGGDSSAQAPSAQMLNAPPITQEVLSDPRSSPVMRAREGGYIKSADGKAMRGKTKGRLL
jgi:hypothetical protein